MRLIPSDPDIASIVRRINNGTLDLQPNFQRGEVWSEKKRRRLVDSILRQWHIPPIHIIQSEHSSRQEVLDGQQRLAAIRDFVKGEIKVDGTIEPIDADIQRLDGLSFRELPNEWQEKILGFPIRIFSLVDYKPGEPAELFYRLNQPANLTASEQRNAFFGAARDSIKLLVAELNSHINSSTIGFSNSRMAYDDIVARLCVALENGGIRQKLSAANLADRYRSGEPFDPQVMAYASRGIFMFGKSSQYWSGYSKLNKATMFSWLWMLSNPMHALWEHISYEQVGNFFADFELSRNSYKPSSPGHKFSDNKRFDIRDSDLASLFLVYTDRSTSRVADVTSVVARDAILWYCAANHPETQNAVSHSPQIRLLLDISQPVNDNTKGFWNDAWIDRLISSGWGDIR